MALWQYSVQHAPSQESIFQMIGRLDTNRMPYLQIHVSSQFIYLQEPTHPDIYHGWEFLCRAHEASIQ